MASVTSAIAPTTHFVLKDVVQSCSANGRELPRTLKIQPRFLFFERN